ncbi:MAG: hypothetical protein RBR87_00080 [Bacteroidales bacterium]|jgi:hypothetical protein|nr:hypothetical protein [Bacteroidales bacterium]
MPEKRVSKFIEMLMAFAIFWMVIGDLITYHQQVIFGVNYFDTRNPFTKPKSKDDGKTISFKQFKVTDKSDGGFSIVHAGILHKEAQKHSLNSHYVSVMRFISRYKGLLMSLSGNLRGPPTLF